MVVPYLFVMTLLWGGAWIVARFVPVFREELKRDACVTGFTPQLEGLRGLLACSVFVHHAVVAFEWRKTGLWQIPAYGFSSQLAVIPVSLFFALTGYLFWSKLLRRPELNVGPFLWARLRRLVPVYLAAVLTVYAIALWRSHFALKVPGLYLLGNSARWLLFGLAGLPDINGVKDTSLTIAGTPWTLAYEWLFYLMLPLLLWFARKWYRGIYVVACGAVISQYLVFMHKRPSAVLDMAHGMAMALATVFGIGILVASFRQRVPRFAFAETPLASVIALAVMLFVAFRLPAFNFYWAEALLLSVPFLLIVSGTTLFGLLTSSPMLVLGKVSYSCYLMHGLVLWLMIGLLSKWKPLEEVSVVQFWIFTGFVSLVLLGISCTSYRWLEYPYMRKAAPPGPNGSHA